MNNLLKIKSKLWRRILIVYLSINFFALITSVFNVDLSYSTKYQNEAFNEADFRQIAQIAHHIYLDNLNYIFTGTDGFDSGYNNRDHFWPNIDFKTWNQVKSFPEPGKEYTTDRTTFWGIFKGYDITEFFVYTIFPFVLILIKKLW